MEWLGKEPPTPAHYFSPPHFPATSINKDLIKPPSIEIVPFSKWAKSYLIFHQF